MATIPLKIGDKAPDFKAQCTTADTQFTLSEMDCNGVVLYFYPKDNTPGCTIEANDFSQQIPEFERLGIKVFGVSKDNLQSHKDFTEQCNLSFELLMDQDGIICERYGVLKEKSIFGKKYIVTDRTTFFIDKNMNIVNIWPDVNPIGHAQDVKRFVESWVGRSSK